MTATFTRLVLVLSLALGPLVSAATAQDAAARPASDAAVVNLNSATPEQLEALPGIGPRNASSNTAPRTAASRRSKT